MEFVLLNRLTKNRFYNLEKSGLFQQYLRHINGLRSKKTSQKLEYIKKSALDEKAKISITCAGKRDGGGAQLHACISTIVFANSMGIRYHHTPLIKVEHNYNNDPLWEAKWENYLDLTNLYSPRLNNQDYLFVDNYHSIVDKIYEAITSKNDLNIRVLYCHGYSDGHPQEFVDVLDNIRNHFFLRRNPQLVYSPFDFNIAIHMRRGDVTINRWTERYTSSQCIQALINHLRFYFRKARPRFYIFSYSDDDDLKILEDEDVRLFVDMNVFSVMDHLAYADCLVMAKSSMSYVAGMLNRGLVLYQPFWSVCLPHWFRADGFFV